MTQVFVTIKSFKPKNSKSNQNFKSHHKALSQLLLTLDTSVSSNVIELVQWLQLHILPEDIALEPIRKRLGDLIMHVHTRGYGKDIVKFFQCTLLGLGDPEEDHD